jgi:Flp pilus assembly protein TadB
MGVDAVVATSTAVHLAFQRPEGRTSTRLATDARTALQVCVAYIHSGLQMSRAVPTSVEQGATGLRCHM